MNFKKNGGLKNFMKKIYWKILLLIKNCPFNSCLYLRRFLCKNLFKKFGKNCFLTDLITISNPGNISLGDRVSIHQYSLLDATAEIRIGNKVAIGSHSSFITSSHNFDNQDVPIKDQGINSKEIEISDNVWIGSGVTVLQGVKIGKNSIIGAKSLVNKNVPENVIAVGVPCKILKNLK